MKWTERKLQNYRENICNEVSWASCEECLKTKEDINECFLDLDVELRE